MSDSEKLANVLLEKTMMVLEEMCFMFPEDEVSRTFYPEAGSVVPFTGTVSGDLTCLSSGN